MTNIAIFASGNGSNAERIIQYFADNKTVNILTVATNNPKARVLDRAKRLGVSYFIFTREEFYDGDDVVRKLKRSNIDIIVLAGFLWLVPQKFIDEFPRTLNIHPALLPKYGGKGMYGMKIHEAVVKNHEEETGITIHWVNNKYDEGKIILQKSFKIKEGETPGDIAQKIHELEYKFYPIVIEKIAGINR